MLLVFDILIYILHITPLKRRASKSVNTNAANIFRNCLFDAEHDISKK